jgi:hypothetical protein
MVMDSTEGSIVLSGTRLSGPAGGGESASLSPEEHFAHCVAHCPVLPRYRPRELYARFYLNE